jgi:Ni,Fe-hydrogenase I large subunit
MKAKTIVSIIAAIFIVVVIIKIITDVGPNGDWTLALAFIGLLVGILAVIINGLPKKEKSADDYSKFISQQTSNNTNQNLSPEQKALRALESGAIDYTEYEDKLKKIKEEEKRVIEAKAYVDESLGKLKELLQAGILSSEEFTRETTRICQENGVSIPSQFIEKSIQDSVQDDSRAGKIIKLMELKDEGKLTEEEYEEQISIL